MFVRSAAVYGSCNLSVILPLIQVHPTVLYNCLQCTALRRDSHVFLLKSLVTMQSTVLRSFCGFSKSTFHLCLDIRQNRRQNSTIPKHFIFTGFSVNVSETLPKFPSTLLSPPLGPDRSTIKMVKSVCGSMKADHQYAVLLHMWGGAMTSLFE